MLIQLKKLSYFIYRTFPHRLYALLKIPPPYLLNRAGYHGRQVPHGWRSTFSTVMNERAERMERRSDRAIIDLMLAHIPPGATEMLYNRSAYMARGREIAQKWADLIIGNDRLAAALLDGPRRRK